MRYKPCDHCRENTRTGIVMFFLPCFIPAYPHELTKESNRFLKYILLELYAQKWLKNKQNILQKVTKFILKKITVYVYTSIK